MQEEEVYADWGALRFLLPGAVIAIFCVVGAFAAYLQFWPGAQTDSAQNQTAEDGTEVDQVELSPQEVAQLRVSDFEAALIEQSIARFDYAFSTGQEAQAQLNGVTAGLGLHQIEVSTEPVQLVDNLNARTPTTIRWTLVDDDPAVDGTQFTTSGELELVLIGSEWELDWDPSILESTLVPGDVLKRERFTSARAPILARDGTPLASEREATQVGVVKRPVNDVGALANQLAPLLKIDSGDIVNTLSPRPSDEFVLLSTLLPAELDPIRGELQALPGVEFRQTTMLAPISPTFGRAWLGRSGEVTKEILDNNPDLFSVGDVVGLSGLQATYNSQLASQPGFRVVIDRRFKRQTDPSEPAQSDQGVTETTVPSNVDDVEQPASSTLPDQVDGENDSGALENATDSDVLYSSAGTQGTPLQLTIETRVQQAAEQALTRTDKVSALVAVEASTGQILAAANGPGAAVDNFAFTGQYPPGSIFKTVTSAGALKKGLGLNTPIDCPLTLVVDGREFKNAEGEVLGQVPLLTNYALSCNTGFINIGSVMEPSEFPAAAAELGVGVEYELGVNGFSGNVPVPSTPVEKAATSFGQGQVLVSPLSMAVMSASVAAGAYTPPSFIVEPDATPAVAAPLDPQVASSLQQMMRAVVTQGTGNAVGGVAGGPVSGKTGTAEFGNEVPPKAHAWFVGFQGDIAFAVFVEGGEFGGSTAAPIAGDFLNILAQNG